MAVPGESQTPLAQDAIRTMREALGCFDHRGDGESAAACAATCDACALELLDAVHEMVEDGTEWRDGAGTGDWP